MCISFITFKLSWGLICVGGLTFRLFSHCLFSEELHAFVYAQGFLLFCPMRCQDLCWLYCSLLRHGRPSSPPGPSWQFHLRPLPGLPRLILRNFPISPKSLSPLSLDCRPESELWSELKRQFCCYGHCSSFHRRCGCLKPFCNLFTLLSSYISL